MINLLRLYDRLVWCGR